MDQRTENTRRCIVTGQCLPKTALIRTVIGPEDQVVADVENALPGRGIWLCAARDVVNTACKRNLFAKAARRRVTVAPDLADVIEAQLARRCLDLVGLARRSDLVAAGFEKVRAQLARGAAAVLLEALDGAPDGRRKLIAMAPDVPVIDLFDAETLGAALGRGGTVHVAVAPGKLANRLRLEAARLAGFRKAPDTGSDAGIAARTGRKPDG
ncbi:MAG: RNA-binding protein [Magnetospiraceae bacterium]